MTDMRKITDLVLELERKDARMRDAYDRERLARAEVLEEIWRVVAPVIPTIGATMSRLRGVEGPWHAVGTSVVPERGGDRHLNLVLHGERPNTPLFCLHRPGEDIKDLEVATALAVCQVGHRWRLADVADSLEDLLMRANEGKIERREKEATERAEVLRATAVLLRKVKG